MTTNLRDLGDALMVTMSRCKSMCQLRRMSGISGGRGPVMPNTTLRKTLRMLAEVLEAQRGQVRKQCQPACCTPWYKYTSCDW